MVNSLINERNNGRIEKNDRCCGESGTLAVTRPDISTQVRFRKEEELKKGLEQVRAENFDGDVKILTTCPACLQGLARYTEDTGAASEYIVVEIARNILGEDWLADYVERASRGGIERIVV